MNHYKQVHVIVAAVAVQWSCMRWPFDEDGREFVVLRAACAHACTADRDVLSNLPRSVLAVARKQATSQEILLWMTPSEAPKALQASECSELLDPMRASCWISAQH